MLAYHDEEWGVPVRDDRALFGKLILDGFQAGLSWRVILHKRARFLEVFDGFDPARMARYDRRKVAQLLRDPGIVRNRQKVAAAVTNARAFLEFQAKEGAFAPFLWSFVGGAPKQNRRRSLRELPARTRQSDAMSEALAARGFRFTGSTIDRKSTRLNSSHGYISYAVFCLKTQKDTSELQSRLQLALRLLLEKNERCNNCSSAATI